jgi:hypothetical protein
VIDAQTLCASFVRVFPTGEQPVDPRARLRNRLAARSAIK